MDPVLDALVSDPKGVAVKLVEMWVEKGVGAVPMLLDPLVVRPLAAADHH